MVGTGYNSVKEHSQLGAILSESNPNPSARVGLVANPSANVGLVTLTLVAVWG